MSQTFPTKIAFFTIWLRWIFMWYGVYSDMSKSLIGSVCRIWAVKMSAMLLRCHIIVRITQNNIFVLWTDDSDVGNVLKCWNDIKGHLFNRTERRELISDYFPTGVNTNCNKSSEDDWRWGVCLKQGETEPDVDDADFYEVLKLFLTVSLQFVSNVVELEWNL